MLPTLPTIREQASPWRPGEKGNLTKPGEKGAGISGPQACC